MGKYVYLNGAILEAKDARIPVTDRAILHGFGLFETIRAYHSIPFRLGEHLKRMALSAKHFKIPYPISYYSFQREIVKLIRANRTPECSVRVTLTQGTEGGRSNIFATTSPLPLLPKSLYRDGVKIVVAQWRRNSSSPIYGHKTLNYMENILGREEAKRLGAIDAIFLDERNRILEGTASNVFVVNGGRVATPPLRSHILPGVTRKTIIAICRAERTPLIERPMRMRDLLTADEVFITNAIVEVMPVRTLGNESVGNGGAGPVATRILQRYRDIVEHETAGGRSGK